MTSLEEHMARLPDDWTPTYTHGKDILGCGFSIDLRYGPIIIDLVDGKRKVFMNYTELHKYISGLFIPKK